MKGKHFSTTAKLEINRLNQIIDYLEKLLEPLKEEREKLFPFTDEFRDATIEELHCKNWKQDDIAKQTGVTQACISRKVRMITKPHLHSDQADRRQKHTHGISRHIQRLDIHVEGLHTI